MDFEPIRSLHTPLVPACSSFDVYKSPTQTDLFERLPHIDNPDALVLLQSRLHLARHLPDHVHAQGDHLHELFHPQRVPAGFGEHAEFSLGVQG